MIPDSVRLSFYFGAAVFFLAVLWTVLRSREYAPEEMARSRRTRPARARARRAPDGRGVQLQRQATDPARLILLGDRRAAERLAGAGAIYQVMILSAGLAVVGLLLIVSGLLQRSGRYDNGFVTILNDFQDMPQTMKQLAWVQFFSWFALFAMWIYTTPAVTSHLYGTTDTTSALYNEGANWVGVGFGAYNGVAAVVAFAIPLLARRTSRRIAHAICLVCGALGLLSILVSRTPASCSARWSASGSRGPASSRCRTRSSPGRCRRRRWATTWACSISSS